VLTLNHGKTELEVTQVSPERITTRVIIGDLLGERKGIHIPGAKLEFPSLTKKDIKDIQLGIELGIDYIAQSFVRKSDDILMIKDLLRKEGREDIGVLAKIEDNRGVESIDEIIKICDGIMIARAVTPNYCTAQQLLLYWGVETMVVDKVPDIEKHFEYFLNQAIRKNLISRGELVVLMSGITKESDRPSGSIKLLST